MIDLPPPKWCTSCGFALAQSREVHIIAKYLSLERRVIILSGYCSDCVRHDRTLALLRSADLSRGGEPKPDDPKREGS